MSPDLSISGKCRSALIGVPYTLFFFLLPHSLVHRGVSGILKAQNGISNCFLQSSGCRSVRVWGPRVKLPSILRLNRPHTVERGPRGYGGFFTLYSTKIKSTCRLSTRDAMAESVWIERHSASASEGHLGDGGHTAAKDGSASLPE